MARSKYKGVLPLQAARRLDPEGLRVMRDRGWLPPLAGGAGLPMEQRGTSYPDSPGPGGANLVPLEQASEIISAVLRGSAALQFFRHVPMSRYQERVPVLSVLPQASFVTGEVNRTSGLGAGMKVTTFADWEGRYLQAEEVAAIVPIAEALLADSEYDIWGELTPLLADSIGRALDAAIFFGYNKPASYPGSIVEQALLVGNSVVAGTASQANGALAADIANLFATVEQDGFDVNGVAAKVVLRQMVRNARMTIGAEFPEINPDEWYGQKVTYPLRGLWPASVAAFTGNTTSGQPQVTAIASTASLQPGMEISGAGIPAGATIVSVDSSTQVTLSEDATATATGVSFNETPPIAVAGDYTQGLLGVRQDITWKVLDQAVLTDAAGNIQINLAQQDAVALRVVARFGFAVANVVTYDQPTEANRWPFGVLLA